MTKKRPPYKPDNPPVYPRTGYYPDTINIQDIDAIRERLVTETHPQDGISLRDLAALHVLGGIYANQAMMDEVSLHIREQTPGASPEQIC